MCGIAVCGLNPFCDLLTKYLSRLKTSANPNNFSPYKYEMVEGPTFERCVFKLAVLMVKIFNLLFADWKPKKFVDL
jgi:hypothetical protein